MKIKRERERERERERDELSQTFSTIKILTLM